MTLALFALALVVGLPGCPRMNQESDSRKSAPQVQEPERERESKVVILTYRNTEEKQREEARLDDLTSQGWQVNDTETTVLREPDAHLPGGLVMPGDTITTVTVTLERTK